MPLVNKPWDHSDRVARRKRLLRIAAIVGAVMLLVGVAIFLIAGCSGNSASAVETPPLPTELDTKVVVDVFASKTCSICNHELPYLAKRIEAFNAPTRRAKVRLFMTDANATVDSAKRYMNSLGINSFEPMADPRCRVKYREYYSGTSCYVPGHAILSSKEQIVYPVGSVNLNGFMRDLESLTNGSN